MRWIGGRAHTVLNTPPAPSVSPELDALAKANKIRLDSLVTKAERTVAASHAMFAERAARELRRL